MVCRTAYIVKVPVVEEITEKKVYIGSGNTNFYYERLLVPTYRVSWDFDFGPCCGVDSFNEEFATAEAAQAEIDKVLINEHKRLKYNPEFLWEDDVE